MCVYMLIVLMFHVLRVMAMVMVRCVQPTSIKVYSGSSFTLSPHIVPKCFGLNLRVVRHGGEELKK